MVPSWGCRGGNRCPAFFPGSREVKRNLPWAGWCHPLRRRGIMVTRNQSASKLRSKESWCGRRDLNPHSPCGKTDFLTRLRLSPPLHSTARFGVWTIPSPLSRMYRRGFRCCPSSLYTFPTGFPRKGLARDRHLTGFPEFEQFCIAGFPTSTQVFRLSPLRLPIPPRPRGWLNPWRGDDPPARKLPTVDFNLLLRANARSSSPSSS